MTKERIESPICEDVSKYVNRSLSLEFWSTKSHYYLYSFRIELFLIALCFKCSFSYKREVEDDDEDDDDEDEDNRQTAVKEEAKPKIMFSNDGSFLEQFKRMQEMQKKRKFCLSVLWKPVEYLFCLYSQRMSYLQRRKKPRKKLKLRRNQPM